MDFENAVNLNNIEPNKVNASELPSDFTKHISLESLVTLKLPVIKTMALIYSNNVIYPLLKDLKNATPEELIVILRSEKCMAEAQFWDVATRIYVAIENGFVERLQSEGVEFEIEEDMSQFLARVIANAPQKIDNFVKELSSSHTGIVGEKSSHVFECPVEPHQASAFLKASKISLEKALEEPFRKRGYEDLCEIEIIENEAIVGLKIVRGSKRTMTRVRDLEKVKRYRDDQKIKEDLIYLVKDASLLWISCSSAGDAQMYANVISSLMLGRDVLGLRKDTSMSSLLNKNLGQTLTRAAQELGVVRIEVREIMIKLAPRGKFADSASRFDPCLTEFFSRWEAIDPKHQLNFIKFRLVFDAKGKDYLDVELKYGTIKPALGLKPETVCNLLGLLGVWKARGH